MSSWRGFNLYLDYEVATFYCPKLFLTDILEIQQFYGSDATPAGLRFQYFDRIRYAVQALRAARAAGIDCKLVVLNGGVNTKG